MPYRKQLASQYAEIQKRKEGFDVQESKSVAISSIRSLTAGSIDRDRSRKFNNIPTKLAG
jgi:hypothetical protein